MLKKDLKKYDKRYKESKGMACPVCGDTDFDAERINVDGTIGTSSILCLTCGSIITEVWRFDGLCDIAVSDKGRRLEKKKAD